HREAAGAGAIHAPVEAAVAAVASLPAARAAHHLSRTLIVHEAAASDLAALALAHPAASAACLPSALAEATADGCGGVPLAVPALAGPLASAARSLAGPSGALLIACVLALARAATATVPLAS